MIIYGTRTISRDFATGSFHCPLCKAQRQYRHIVNKRYFALYFIPLFPIYQEGEYLQCSSCGEGFGMEALHGGIQGVPAFAMDDLRRAMLLVLMQANRFDVHTLAGLRHWCHSIGLQNTTDQVITQELQLAQQAGATFAQFAAAKLSHFTPDQKQAFLQAAKQILSGSNRPSQGDEQVLRDVATQLGMPPWSLAPLLA